LITSGSSAAVRSYRPDIDGLRALAILSVVFYHGGTAWLPGGFTGVDIFFVISGYLIGGHIYAELRAGDFSYLRFYRRRAKRILPALLAVLAFTLLAAMLLLSPGEAAQLARDGCAATLSAANILFWGTANYFAGKSELNPLLMTWSLGVEEQFYAVIPVLMVLVARMRRGAILPATVAVCIASFAFAAVLAHRYPMMVFYLLPARAWELGAGVALAVREVERNSKSPSKAVATIASCAGLALIIAPMFLLTAQTELLVPPPLFSVLGTVLLIAAPASWINRRLLSLAPLTFIGRVSYSWYLWHWPMLAFMHIVCGVHLPAAVPAVTIAASLVAAALSWRFIEQPFRGSRRAPVPLLIRYGIASAALLLVCGVVWLSGGVPQRFPALAAMETAGRALQSDPCLAGSTSDEPNLQAACYGVSASGPSVALWGDSHSAALAPGLRAVAAAQGFGFVQLGKASCPPLIGATHFIPRVPLLAAGCARFNRKVLDLIVSDRRIRILVLTAVWSAPLNRTWENGWLTADTAHAAEIPTADANSRLFIDSLTTVLGTLEAGGKRVVVIEDVPSFEIDPLWRVRSARILARRRLSAWLGIRDAIDPGFAPPDANPNIAAANSLLHQAVARVPGVQLVDLNPALCSASSECVYRSGEQLLYDDSSHLSTFGSIYALRDFRLPSANGSSP
jgi:peptidoglycan/LPS O-acetylase OafA/YrhL